MDGWFEVKHHDFCFFVNCFYLNILEIGPKDPKLGPKLASLVH